MRCGEEGDQLTLIVIDLIGRREGERERRKDGRPREGIGEWDFVGDSLSPAVSSEPSASWIKRTCFGLVPTYVSLHPIPYALCILYYYLHPFYFLSNTCFDNNKQKTNLPCLPVLAFHYFYFFKKA